MRGAGRSLRVQTDVLQCYPIGRLRIKHLSALKTAEYNGNGKRFEYGERRDAAGCLGTKKCGKKNCGSSRDAQATLCRRAFPYGKGSVRAVVYQSPYLAGLPKQEDYSLHAVCRKDTLQGFGLGEDTGGELQELANRIKAISVYW